MMLSDARKQAQNAANQTGFALAVVIHKQGFEYLFLDVEDLWRNPEYKQVGEIVRPEVH